MNDTEKSNYKNKLKQMTMEFNMPKEQMSIIKIIGVGGGGGNAVNHMYNEGIRGVNYIICNTDQQSLDLSPIMNKVQLGPEITQGLGAGSKPEIGEKATIESTTVIQEILANNTKMVFVTAGMGGGTGTGGAPIIAKIARDMGILTVGIVTTPFSFEGRRKLLQANEGIKKLKENVDALIVVSNDKISEIYGDLGNGDAFARANDVLLNGAKSISEIITVSGTINVDFADVQYVIKNSGIAIMGTGVAEGEERDLRAVQMALESPLLDDNNITGAHNILINITSGVNQVTINEINNISNYVQDAAGNETDIIFGTCDDESLGEKISITLIATGFEKKSINQEPQVKEIIQLETPIASKEEVKPTNSTENIDLEANITEYRDDEIHIKQNVVEETNNTEEELSFYTTQRETKEEEKQELDKEDSMRQKYLAHKKELNQVSYKWESKNKEMDEVPAFKRRGVNLDDVQSSSTNNTSKYTLDTYDINGEIKPEIRKDNSFLSDNVD